MTAATADITLINLNMLFIRYGERIERELHVPLGSLYLTRALEDAGLHVDFRDYQTCPVDDVFKMETFLDFTRDPAPVIGLSCMANLLPFTMLAARALRRRYPDRVIVLGGVGAKAVEEKILTRFPWIDVIHRGEGESSGPILLDALKRARSAPGGLTAALKDVPSITYRAGGAIIHNPDAPRCRQLDAIPFPAWEKIDLNRYAGYGMMTSRGCPYPCTFCSVAPVWNWETYSRSPRSIVDEMEHLNQSAGVDLFLFQDEFFLSGKRHVMEFCEELRRRRLHLEWKAFGRVNLVDEELMETMAATGCLELRFGIESGSDAILRRIKKGFTTAEVLDLIPRAVKIFPRVDAFYVWGFPFETMEDFYQSVFQMVSFRMMGARILPSLLSLLPQTEIFKEYASQTALEFCPYLFPEFVFTGHEICRDGSIEIPEEYTEYFDLIRANPDIFPGFFHIDLERNVLPKLAVLRQFGFYPEASTESAGELAAAQVATAQFTAGSGAGAVSTESCGAHSPRIAPQDLITRAGR